MGGQKEEKKFKRQYVFKVTEDDKEINFSATNSGFNFMELLGFFSFKTADIIEQLRNAGAPKENKKFVAIDGKEEEI